MIELTPALRSSVWEDTFQKIGRLISLEFIRHRELETSLVLSSYEKEQYHRLASENANEVDYQMGLQLLSMLLHKHYSKECIIIIDEYDTPIQQGHSCNFYSEIVNFMRNFFSGGLKDNPHLAFGFLTGILRVAKESIFSGMNNLKINSILDESYPRVFYKPVGIRISFAHIQNAAFLFHSVHAFVFFLFA